MEINPCIALPLPPERVCVVLLRGGLGSIQAELHNFNRCGVIEIPSYIEEYTLVNSYGVLLVGMSTDTGDCV